MDIAQLVCPDPRPAVVPAPPLPASPALRIAPIFEAVATPSASSTVPTALRRPPPVPATTTTTSARRVTCHLCGKSFSGVSSHNRHVSRTHHKARPFLCRHCPAAFGQKGSLERHIAGVHRKERPFACGHCAKAFGRSDNLRIHVATVHLNHRPHQCPSCPKRFGGRRPLRIHTQTVHLKQRPLECTLCARRFGQRSNLNAHIRHVHKRDPAAVLAGTPASASAVQSAPRGLEAEGTAPAAVKPFLPPLAFLPFGAGAAALPTSPATSTESSGKKGDELDSMEGYRVISEENAGLNGSVLRLTGWSRAGQESQMP